MEKDEFIEQCSAYATGALEDDDRRRFEEYLRTSSKEELDLLAELVVTASSLPLALDRRLPPPHVKEQLMRKVHTSARAQKATIDRTTDMSTRAATHRRSWMPLGVGAAIGMTAIFALFVLRLLNTIDEQNRQLVAVQGRQQQLQTEFIALKDELTRKEELLKVLSSKRIEITVMDGSTASPVSYGKIIWDPEKRTAILQVSNLPPVPSNRDYQLWVIKDKKPISAGIFAVNNAEPNYFKIENLAVTNPKEIRAFAITLEPKGGVMQPTGEMYMVGSPKL